MANACRWTAWNSKSNLDSAPRRRPALVDPFGRAITYLRVSVTDRCDFRCVYCMAENMTFLPKAEVLTLEELDRLCSAFVARGVRKLRLTGGEPLVRRGIMTLVRLAVAPSALRPARRTDADHQRLAARQICRASSRPRRPPHQRLARHARRRKNSAPSRAGASFDQVLAGIDAAQAAGLKVKINAVALKGVNEDEFPRLIEWAHGRGMDLTLIEVMPLGEIGEGRLDQYLPLSLVRARLAERFSLDDIDYRTGGPARYVRVAETGGRLGFITPLTHNFCESCNRVRVTCTGTLYMCLGQEDAADLRKPLRASEGNDLLFAAIDEAIGAQAQGPRFHHRSPPPAPGAVAPHERDRRLAGRRFHEHRRRRLQLGEAERAALERHLVPAPLLHIPILVDMRRLPRRVGR